MKLSERLQCLALGFAFLVLPCLLGARAVNAGLTESQAIGVVIWLGGYAIWGCVAIWFGLAKHEWLAARRRDRPHRDFSFGLPFTSRTMALFFTSTAITMTVGVGLIAPPPVNWLHSLGYAIALGSMGLLICGSLGAAFEQQRHPA